MRFLTILLTLLFISSQNSQAQKILQFDASHSGKHKVRFFIGDKLKFKLKDGKGWYTYEITGMDVDKQELFFDEIKVPVSRISEVHYIKKSSRRLAYGCAGLMASFGVGWTVFSVVGLVAKSPAVTWANLIVGAVALAAAAFFFFFKALWVRRTKITDKHRLRVVDLTIHGEGKVSVAKPKYEGPIAGWGGGFRYETLRCEI